MRRINPDFRVAVASILVILTIGSLFNRSHDSISYATSYEFDVDLEPKHGDAIVTRRETYWQNTVGPHFTDEPDYARYILTYKIFLYNETNQFAVEDKLTPQLDLFWWRVDYEYENVDVTYTPENGVLSIYISDANPHANARKKYQISVWFISPFISKFMTEPPITENDPAILESGLETDLLIYISPFKVLEQSNLESVEVVATISGLAEEIEHIRAHPSITPEPPMYRSTWKYDRSHQVFGEHSTKYHLLIDNDATGVIFYTSVNLRYNASIIALGKPIFNGANVEFVQEVSTFSYQYSHPLIDENPW